MAEGWPASTAELLGVIQGEWDKLMKAVERLTPEQMTRADAGGWSPKDNLAHLAEWMTYMKASYINKAPGHEGMRIPAERFGQLDEDGINAVLFERNRNRPAPEVLDWLKSTYADVLETLQGMPFSDLLKPVRELGPDKRLVIATVLANTSEHFLEHRKAIERGTG